MQVTLGVQVLSLVGHSPLLYTQPQVFTPPCLQVGLPRGGRYSSSRAANYSCAQRLHTDAIWQQPLPTLASTSMHKTAYSTTMQLFSSQHAITHRHQMATVMPKMTEQCCCQPRDQAAQLILSNSTSKLRVAFGGITPPAPLAPYA